jgi:hypothetical protein
MSRAPFTKVHDVPNPVAARVLPLRRLGLQKGKKTYKLGPRNSAERSKTQINLLLLYSFEEQRSHTLFTQFDTECRPLRRKKIMSSVRLASRAMTAEGCLALALMFLSSEAEVEVKLLNVLFGLQEQCALKYIKVVIFLSKKVRGHSSLTVFSLAFCGTVFIC